MKSYSEDELIAYQMGEGTAKERAAIAAWLESDADAAKMAEEIAETLHVFSAGPVPAADFEKNWLRVRGGLTVLEPAKRSWARWPMFAGASAAMAALLVGVFWLGLHTRVRNIYEARVAKYGNHAIRPMPAGYNGEAAGMHDVSLNGGVAGHLDAAERLLTQVNHDDVNGDGEMMQAEAHQLLLRNAVYERSATERGDYTQAAVLGNLGRVLTTMDREPATEHKTLEMKLDMNTDGLLLEIRILRQNQGQ